MINRRILSAWTRWHKSVVVGGVILAAGLCAGGCDVALSTDAPDRSLLPNCTGTDDAAIIQALDQVENAWQQDVARLDVLAIGFGSGCQDACFECWQEITDLVYFSIH